MEKRSTINERIKMIVDSYANGRNTILASKLGVNEANIRGYISNVQPKSDFLEKLVISYDISPDWLLTGRGSMERVGGVQVEGVSISGSNEISGSTIVGNGCSDRCELVRMLTRQTDAQNAQILKLLEMVGKPLKRD